MNNKKEVVELHQKQKLIRTEITQIQKKIPVFIIIYLLSIVLLINFLEADYIMITFFSITLIFLFIISYMLLKVFSKKKETKNIGKDIFKIMKLDQD